jgi:hypothetical protein
MMERWMDDSEVLERVELIATHYKRLVEIDGVLNDVPALRQERSEIMDALRAILLTPTTSKE